MKEELDDVVKETYKLKKEGKEYYTVKWRNLMVLARKLEKPEIIKQLWEIWENPTNHLKGVGTDEYPMTLPDVERYLMMRSFRAYVPYRHTYLEMEQELVKLDVELTIILIDMAKELGIELVPTKMKVMEIG